MDGVVINADSLQLYQGLPILTAFPNAADREAAPHSLYGVLAPDQSCDAIAWRTMALAEIRAAVAQGRVPIVAGGTGFYIKTLIEGLSPIPPIPEAVRVLSDDLIDRIGLDEFFKQLQEIDPVWAAKADPYNRQRLVRAFEVYHHTGSPMSYWQSLPPVDVAHDLDFKVQVLMPERDVLYRRCDARFDTMMERGALDEVRAFDDRIARGDVPSNCALTHALGFRPLQAHLNGESDLVTAIYLAKAETRHYAKRQVTWFRHQMDLARG